MPIEFNHAKSGAPAPGIGAGWALGFKLPPRRTISEWADAKRMIAAGTGPEPGRWRTDRTPYLREPMDSLADPVVEITVLKMSSQVGKTEVFVNAAGYYIDQDPAPVLLVLPTLELADSFSTKRFDPTIDASPALRDRIGPHASRAGATTIREKAFPGGDIVFAGANSPASLASRPRRVVLFDEIDKYKANIGHDGDPIRQGFQRTQNFWNAKKALASTPTIEGVSQIDEWFKRSDQRHYEVPCHACGAFQALEWEHVRWEPGHPETARYCCSHCDEAWDQRQVAIAVRHGHWSARAPFTGVRGYHVWAIYSPWVSMADLASEWEDAAGKPGEEQAFTNLKLGRCWNPAKESETTPAELLARREDYGPNADGSYKTPDGVLLVTAHVDVQQNRFEIQYIGWGEDDEKWVLDYGVLYADPTSPNAWLEMESRFLLRTFTHPTGHEMQLEAVAIDAGYLQQRVLEFCRDARASFKSYYAVKGVPGAGRPIIRASNERFKDGAKLYLTGIDDGKTTLYQELSVRPDQKSGVGGYRVHFPKHLELNYFQQLVAERVLIEFKSGFPVRRWVCPPGKRNEALDTFVGAMAARYTLSVDYQMRRATMTGTAKTFTGGDIAALFEATR